MTLRRSGRSSRSVHHTSLKSSFDASFTPSIGFKTFRNPGAPSRNTQVQKSARWSSRLIESFTALSASKRFTFLLCITAHAENWAQCSGTTRVELRMKSKVYLETTIASYLASLRIPALKSVAAA